MKLSISNIAWDRHDDPQILSVLTNCGVQGIEIAPTKIWNNWEGANKEAAKNYRDRLADQGFAIPAMQAILFGRPDLKVFDAASHNDFLTHIRLIAELAEGLGAKVLVFGSPKNRLRGQLSIAKAFDMAADFFREAGKICHEHGCCIGIEHNPVEYGCDFVTNAADARALVDRVDHPGVQLHIDSAGLYMCGSDITRILKDSDPFVHFHISEPMLAPIAGGVVNHVSLLSTLNEMQYDKWISIEMRMPEQNTAEVIAKSIQTLLNKG